jgi:hypothetical protein
MMPQNTTIPMLPSRCQPENLYLDVAAIEHYHTNKPLLYCLVAALVHICLKFTTDKRLHISHAQQKNATTGIFQKEMNMWTIILSVPQGA